MSAVMLGLGVAVAVAVWTFLFHGRALGLAARSWVSAVVVTGYALLALGLTGRLDEVIGHVSAVEVAIGLGVGIGWLVATHLGHRMIRWLVPAFGSQVRDLYRLQAGDASAAMVAPVLAMCVAEELFFRGFVQAVAGLVLGVVIYGAVQATSRNWALIVAALLCGALWGSLVWWRDGLVAAIAAHVVWTGALVFVWPLTREPDGLVRARADVAPVTRTIVDDDLNRDEEG